MNRDRLIFHIDVNAAFLSWESVYRLSQDPQALDLRTISSAVGGDATKRHGIILAKSTSAKRFGVTTGEPVAQALRKCPSLVVVPSRFDHYISCSRQLMELLENYTPDMEKFSIDEAFLDMTNTIHLFGEPLETARYIREQVQRELHFTVNIGIAPNKLLAKMASDFEKPNRCHTLATNQIPDKLWPLPIRELFFVGHSAQKKLENIGIHTIGQLANCHLSILKSHLGDKYATLIHQYANGVDDSPVEERNPINKGYGNSITLSRDISDMDAATHVLLSLCETVGARLRADKVQCNCICVEFKDWDFHTKSHQLTLDSSTDSTSVIFTNACRLLKDCWNLTPVRLLGVRAAKITEENFSQLSFFDNPQTQRMRHLEQAVDSIRSKYGTDSIKRASFLQKGSLVDHASGKEKHMD